MRRAHSRRACRPDLDFLHPVTQLNAFQTRAQQRPPMRFVVIGTGQRATQTHRLGADPPQCDPHGASPQLPRCEHCRQLAQQLPNGCDDRLARHHRPLKLANHFERDRRSDRLDGFLRVAQGAIQLDRDLRTKAGGQRVAREGAQLFDPLHAHLCQRFTNHQRKAQHRHGQRRQGSR